MIDAAPTPVRAVGKFFGGAARDAGGDRLRGRLPDRDGRARGGEHRRTLRKATADVFESWIDSGTEWFAAHGVERERARELTLGMVCALEGAFVLSRAMRTAEPLRAAGEAAMAQVRAELAAEDG